jgi:hypothetical protein
MRRSVFVMAATAATALGSAGAVSAQPARQATPAGPTPAQVQAAVSAAESSTYLWATVNVCTARGSGGTIGIRGEMPALGFAATLSMTIQLRQLDTTTDTYSPFPGTSGTRSLPLGRFTDHLHQSGAVFPFTADPGKVQASVTFTWTRAGKVIGTATEATTSGHPQADYGTPAHYSAASCTLGSGA